MSWSYKIRGESEPLKTELEKEKWEFLRMKAAEGALAEFEAEFDRMRRAVRVSDATILAVYTGPDNPFGINTQNQ